MASKKIIVASVLLLAKSTTALQSTEGLVLLQHRSEVTKGSKSATAGLGNTVATTEKGYQAVAGLKSDVDMEAFIRRVLDNEARVVTDEAELTGLVPFYSGSQAVQSLDSLKKELRSVPWVGNGAGRFAPLSEEGYQQVASSKSKANMMAFARRILDANFMKTTDEGALKGMVPYFSGEVAVQSFDQLKKELLSSPFAVSRDSEEALMGGAHPISLAEKQDENTTKAIKLAAKPASCDDWCVGDLFVKVESNVTVMKNLSSWAMKCTWAHCSSCSDCSGVSTLVAERTKNDVATKLSSASKQASCDDWCSSEVFTAVNQNVTSSKNFTWDMKCAWANCGACAKCSSEESSSTVHGKEQALLEEEDKAEDKQATKAKANATKQDENTTKAIKAEVEASYETENVEAVVTAASESDEVEEEDPAEDVAVEAPAEEAAEQLEESTSEAAAVDAVAAEAPAEEQSAEAAPAEEEAAPADEVAAPATRAASKQPSEEKPDSKAASKEPPAEGAVPSKTQVLTTPEEDDAEVAELLATPVAVAKVEFKGLNEPSANKGKAATASKTAPTNASPKRAEASKNASPDNSKDSKASGTVSSTHQKKSPTPSNKTEAKTSDSNGFFHWLSR